MSLSELDILGIGRTLVLVAVVSLVVSSFLIPAGVGTAKAQSTAVTISDVTTEPNAPSAGETFTVSATIINNEGASSAFDINEVYLRTPGGGRSYVADDMGSLPPGASTTVEIPVTVSDPGWHTLELRVLGLDQSQQVVIVNHPVPVQVRGDRSESISMAATADDIGPSARTNLHISIASGLDAFMSGVEIRVESETVILGESRRVTSQIRPGNVSRFTLPIRSADPGQHRFNIQLNYTVAGDRFTIRRNVTTDIERMNQPGRIVLSEINVEQSQASLAIRGSASNIGTTEVSGVLVSVKGSESIRPAEQTSTFFVGTVPASDFSSFDVNAKPTVNGSVSIPIQVSYVVDGVRTNRTFTITHELSRNSGETNATEASSGIPVVPVGTILVIFAVLVIGWRKYRT